MKLRPVVDLRSIPRSRWSEPLQEILRYGDQSWIFPFPWMFDDRPPRGLRAGVLQ